MNARTKAPGLPETVSVTEVVRRRTTGPRISLSPEDLSAKMNQPGPANAAAGMKPGDDFDGSVMRLRCTDIKPYDHNPRTSTNAKYAEIKAGILERGGLPTGSLSVTKRPGSSQYMLYMGGNTRLAILKELWEETGDTRFEYVDVSYKAWKSESDTLAAHLIENEARADTLFWEKATGIIDLRQQLQEETGKVITSRNLEEHTKSLGLQVRQSLIITYDFAVEYLSPLALWLTHDNVRIIKARYAQLEKLATALHDLGRFRSEYSNAFTEVQTRTAASLAALQADQREEDAVQVALRGEPLDALLHAMDAAFGKALNLSADARRISEVAAYVSANPATDIAVIRQMLDATAPLQSSAPSASSASSEPQQASKPDAGTRATPAGSRARLGAARPKPVAPAEPAPAPVAAASASATQAGASESNIGTEEPAGENALMEAFDQALFDFAQTTHVAHWIRPAADLPLGFYLELPATLPIEAAEDPEFASFDQIPDEIAVLRAAAFRLLASLSGQFGSPIASHPGSPREFAERLPAGSRWRAAVEADSLGPDAFSITWEHQMLGAMEVDGTPTINGKDLHKILQHPNAGGQWCLLQFALVELLAARGGA